MGSQHQGAENEACEELHCAERKQEGQGDTDKTFIPLHFGVCMSRRAWLFISTRLSVVLTRSLKRSILNPPTLNPRLSKRSRRWLWWKKRTVGPSWVLLKQPLVNQKAFPMHHSVPLTTYRRNRNQKSYVLK